MLILNIVVDILFYFICGILFVISVISRIMFGIVVKMSTTMDINLLIKTMNDYHFERSNKMLFLILHMIYCIIIIIIIRKLNTYINVYEIIM